MPGVEWWDAQKADNGDWGTPEEGDDVVDLTRLVAVATCWVLAAITAIPASAAENSTQRLLRESMERVMFEGALNVGGVDLAADDLLLEFYTAREFHPAWADRAKIEQLYPLADRAIAEGLDRTDYPFAAIEALLPDSGLPVDENARVAVDILATETFVRIAYQLRFGKLNPGRLFADWNFDRRIVMGASAAEVVQTAIDAPSITRHVAEVIPRGYLYAQLVAALERYRGFQAQDDWPVIPAGATLRQGEVGDRVELLRRRLAAEGDLAAGVSGEPEVFDSVLASAVSVFQARHGLDADAVVGSKTLQALNTPVEHRIDQLRASLERARWVFEDIQKTDDLILVNIASAQTALVRDHKIVWVTRSQVGKSYRQTPVFRGNLEYLVVNPTWTVPPGILRRDVLPRLKEDAVGYLASKEMDLLTMQGQVVDPATVDWANLAGSFPYMVRQRPGPHNALGMIKFIFPNPQFIFLHDTPSRELFNRSARNFSSGCIRIEDPFKLAELVMDNPEIWNSQTFDDVLASRKTRVIHLDEPLAVYLMYWTAMALADGTVQFFDDVYGRDKVVLDGLRKPPMIDLPALASD